METIKNNFSIGVAPSTVNFAFFEYNRELDNNNINKLVESIKERGQLVPIMITNDNYVIDGQHRYIALQQLGMDIIYVVCPNYEIEDVDRINNVRKSWNPMNRIRSLAIRKYPEFEDLLEAVNEWEGLFKPMTVVDAFSGNNKGRSSLKLIKNKTYEFNYSIGHEILSNALLCKDVIKKWNSTKFIRALKVITLRNQDKFDINILIRKAEETKVNIYNNEKEVINEIVQVYNKRLSSKNRIH